MKNTILLVSLIILISTTNNAFSQDGGAQATSGSHAPIPAFGEFTGGQISINEHLEDSLAFTDSLVNTQMHIVSFNLALKCNGNTVKYLENKSGNKLTPEMKAAVQQLHANCTINFEGIKSLSRQKDAKGKYTESKIAPFKLTLK